MRTIGLGLFALILAAVSPTLASAADKPAAPITKEARAKGMAAAPGLLSAAGSDCQMADARFVGDSTDPKTKAKTSLYEVACTGSEGLLVLESAPAASTPPTVFTCMEAATPGPDGKKSGTQCILPGNADPAAGLAPFIAKANITCTTDKVRALGHSSANVYFELACQQKNGGYILQMSSPPRLDKPVSANPCIMFDPAQNVKCILTDRATQLAVVDALATASGKPCTIKDRGFIGVTQGGASYYEVSCADGKGYVLEQAANGSFMRVIDCAEADALAGGCKLTDARQAKTEQAGLYTQLAKKAGFTCTVAQYAPFSIDLPGKEVVELTCSNRPDGAVGIFPASSSEKAEIIDCAHAELRSYRCSLTKPTAAYATLTADLRTLGRTSCTVSASRTVGLSADQRGYIEVGCSDGLPGYMIEYATTPISPKNAIVCAEAKGIAGGCTLPGNVKS